MEVIDEIKKWKKSVIHLECATDSIKGEQRSKIMTETNLRLSEGVINVEEYLEIMSGGCRDIRCQGTAIFFEKDGNRYLLTARHVLNDGSEGKDDIFETIFRVPSLDESLSSKLNVCENLQYLGLGLNGSMPYSFSEPKIDLAIISLIGIYSKFGDELIKFGYKPITLEDISGEPTNEGAEIFTTGFPNTSLVGTISHQVLKDWQSNYYSLPISSFGKVSMLHNSLNYFWGDISIYPGNSGGPVIENNKLVGIVSAQSVINEPVTVNDKGVTVFVKQRIPFAKIIKAKYIFDLLNIQIEKDKQNNLK